MPAGYFRSSGEADDGVAGEERKGESGGPATVGAAEQASAPSSSPEQPGDNENQSRGEGVVAAEADLHKGKGTKESGKTCRG